MGAGAKKSNKIFLGSSRILFFQRGVGVLRGVVRAAFTQNNCFFYVHILTANLAMLGQINTP